MDILNAFNKAFFKLMNHSLDLYNGSLRLNYES